MAERQSAAEVVAKAAAVLDAGQQVRHQEAGQSVAGQSRRHWGPSREMPVADPHTGSTHSFVLDSGVDSIVDVDRSAFESHVVSEIGSILAPVDQTILGVFHSFLFRF